MKPKDPSDMQFAARLVMDGLIERSLMERILQSQSELIEQGRPMTVAQMCVAKKWITKSEARLLMRPEQPFPTLVPGYEIHSLLGVGGMSWVFGALPTGESEEVAMKILKPHLARNQVALRRFRKEARLLIALHHPNIVKGFDLIEHDGLVAFTMEKVPGRMILEYIDEGGPFQEDAALYVIVQIAKALSHLYENGVVHRDIKPGNILLTPDNTVKLCDLGLAADRNDTVDGEFTVGTVEYISPEQAMGEDDVDVRSDIYALGVTLYHMVVGEIPFQGSDDKETMAQRFVDSLSSVGLSRVSPHVHYFIQKMMAADRAVRYQSPKDLIEDIEESIRGKKTLTLNPLAAEKQSLELQRPFEETDKRKKAPTLKRGRTASGRRRRR
ncbi:MAG TPA: serine/threonine protein kinase [Planctomycetes bacterium]|nr:serine/threonine protein kinase [Planctomycetota bacterium]